MAEDGKYSPTSSVNSTDTSVSGSGQPRSPILLRSGTKGNRSANSSTEYTREYSPRRGKLFILTVVVAVAAVLSGSLFPVQSKAAFKATMIQTNLWTNNLMGFSLLNPGFSGDDLKFDLEIDFIDELKLKAIYLSRYLFSSQFLMKSWEQSIHQDILRSLNEQYARNGWAQGDLTKSVPTVDWGQISADAFYDSYVRPGRVVVVRNFSTAAVQSWTTDYFASSYGSHMVEVINTSSVQPAPPMRLADFVQSSKEESLYLRSLSDIFDLYPELLDQLGVHAWDDFIKGKYMTSQIFMGSKRPGSGTSYHCANFNNLFFMIQGRKKWTFVHPNFETLMYPMFNAKSMDVASFVTTVALANKDMMQTHFPLYQLAPKLEITLEPGDVLFNPPWNWHMVENVESESIGVATRWFIGPSQKYQNSLHSTLQWLSPYMWSIYYSKMINLERASSRAHVASNTPPMDERLDFGRTGSAAAFQPRIFPDSFYATIKNE